MLVLVFSYMNLLAHIYKNIGNVVNSGFNGGISFKVGDESKQLHPLLMLELLN